MSDFHTFASLIHARYNELAKHELFTVDRDNDAIKQAYLGAFPEGTNPIYKTNTEHDCSCCKQFIRSLGSVVAIIDNQLETVWGIQGAPYPYDVVAQAMDVYVKQLPITGIFRTKERSYGAKLTLQHLEDQLVKRWNHFHGQVAARHRTDSPDETRGIYATAAHVFKRGLTELLPDAIDQVLELIDNNALYRGEEHKPAVKAFAKLQREYLTLCSTGEQPEFFIWANAIAPASRFRNTVIGTLVQDLSDEVDLEQAVRSFEAKVAPTNYKRPTSLITPSMVKDAMKTINALGLEPALQRRLARISDITVNNVLWVDGSVKDLMKSGLEDLLMQTAKPRTPKKLESENISIADFMENILPTATSIDLFVRNTHMNNFMCLTAPVHEDSKRLFKWNNDFAWSYAGNITDSIKEKVKRAGGNTNAPLRVSLAWFNYDDLDIHVVEPNGNHISYFNKSNKLDVDMNAISGNSREPVENVSWMRPNDGNYLVSVDQFSKRETSNPGFVIEVENGGKVQQFSHATPASKNKQVLQFTIKNGIITKLTTKDMVGGTASQDHWGIKTETFVKVNTMMLSPNHWDGNAVGNKHYFFVLDDCRNDEPARGIYNEFLNPGLEKHRKVFEILGDKTKCPMADEQLSGLGFSSTTPNTVTARVKTGPRRQTFNINF